MQIKDIVDNYFSWITPLTKDKKISNSNRLLILNSFNILKNYYDKPEHSSFIHDSQSIIGSLNFEELTKLSRYDLMVYAAYDGNNTPTTLFIIEWIDYIFKNAQHNNLGILSHLFQSKDSTITIPVLKYEDKDEFKLGTHKYVSVINQITNYGEYPNNIKIDDLDLHLLQAYLINLYKEDYNIIEANILLRAIIYLNPKSKIVIESCINYIKIQQNVNGYFGVYFKTKFTDEEITKILNKTLDCIITLLIYTDQTFSVDRWVKSKLMSEHSGK